MEKNIEIFLNNIIQNFIFVLIPNKTSIIDKNLYINLNKTRNSILKLLKKKQYKYYTIQFKIK